MSLNVSLLDLQVNFQNFTVAVFLLRLKKSGCDLFFVDLRLVGLLKIDNMSLFKNRLY